MYQAILGQDPMCSMIFQF